MKREKLRESREAIGSRPQVAQQLGISVIHLRKLENGDVKPSAPVMLRICGLLKERPEVLFPDVVEDSALVHQI